ncbi:MAG TPA: hypothetical protein VFH61_02795 [Thermoleophilia bacterium]|nr:hypothetical protein [Thermoleophilia bacterium]
MAESSSEERKRLYARACDVIDKYQTDLGEYMMTDNDMAETQGERDAYNAGLRKTLADPESHPLFIE